MILTFYRCPNCKLIIKDPKRSLAKLSTPCTYCGNKNQIRENWPSLDVKILIDLIKKQNLDDYKEQKVAIVFVGTFLERLLEETISNHIEAHVKTREALECLLEGYQGKNKRVRLLQQLFGINIKDIAKGIGKELFMKEWSDIVTIRNKVVHQGFYGKVEGFEKEDINRLINKLLQDSIPVFAEINNSIIQLSKK